MSRLCTCDTVVSALAALLDRLGPFRSELGISMQPAPGDTPGGSAADPITLVTVHFADHQVTAMAPLSALAGTIASLGDDLVAKVAQAASEAEQPTLDSLKQSFRSYLEQSGVLPQPEDTQSEADSPDAADDQQVSYCPYCGRDIAEFVERGASYCPYCGAEL